MADAKHDDVALPGSVEDVSEEMLAAEQLTAKTPSNDELRKLAAQRPPSPEWLQGDEDRPF